MQGNIDILMHHIGLISADLIRDLMPSRSAQGHIGTEQQRLSAIGAVDSLAQGIVALQPEMA